jgi:RNA polymerase sigma factor (sigma-70 family)
VSASDRPETLLLGGAVEAAELRRRLAAVVSRLCPRRLANEREDIVQASYARILEALGARGAVRLEAGYVWKTVHSVTVDEIRRAYRRRERAVGDGDERADPPSPSADPERAAIAHEVGARIRECLGTLDATRRRAVVLRLAGWEHGQAASVLTVSRKAVGNLIFRGMEDLRRCLRGKGVSA